MPRLAARAASHRTIAAGEDGQAFDPIGGVGTGHAIRGTVLAIAMLETLAAAGSRSADLRRLKQTRHDAIAHHLTICRRIYAGFTGPGWAAELAAMAWPSGDQRIANTS